MTSDQGAIRKFLIRFFGDEELTSFAFDYFPAAYDEFAAGMSKGHKAREIITYCRSRDRLDDLLSALQREREVPFAAHLAAAAPPAAAPPAPLPTAAASPANAPLGARPPAARDPHQVFLSHAFADAAFAQRLAAALTAAGWRVWIAPDSIRPGEKWVEAIGRGLEESGVFVLVLTEAAAASHWVRVETNSAIALEARRQIRVFPIRPQAGDVEGVPVLWLSYQQTSFEDFERGLRQLQLELDPERKRAIEASYAALLKAAEAQDWGQVQELGRGIEEGYPDYRDVRRRVSDAQIHQRLATLYEALLAAERAEQWQKVQNLGHEIEGERAGYRDVPKKVAEAQKQIERSAARRVKAVAVVIIVGVALLLALFSSSDGTPTDNTQPIAVTEVPVVALPPDTPTTTAVPSETATDEPAATVTASATPAATATPTSSATPTFLPSSTPWLSLDLRVTSANVRAGPGEAYAIVTVVEAGRDLPILARTDGSSIWYEVRLSDELTGWISDEVSVPSAADWLTVVPTAATTPTLPPPTHTPTPGPITPTAAITTTEVTRVSGTPDEPPPPPLTEEPPPPSGGG